MATAVSTAVPSWLGALPSASTSRMLQFGQIADTMSRSDDSSVAHPASGGGSGLVCPFWFTFVKHPLPHAGRPHAER